MDRLIQFILGISGDPLFGQWLVLILFGGATFALALAIYFLVFGIYNPVRSRLNELTGTKNESRFMRNTTQNLGNYFVIRERAGEKLNYDRERLLHAGYHDKNSLSHYFGIKILLTIGLPLLIFAICSTFFPQLSPTNTLMFVGAGFLLGFIAPSFYLDSKVDDRKRIIRNSFPDVVDQLIVCTEAGLGLDAGLQRVAKDSLLSNETMGYELGQVNAELRAGVA